MILETVGASEEASGNDTEEDTDEDLNPGASTSAEYEHQCFVCSFETDTERRMTFHMIMPIALSVVMSAPKLTQRERK